MGVLLANYGKPYNTVYMIKTKYWLALGCLSLILAGCSGFMTKPETPQLTLAGLNLVGMDLLEQRFTLRLRIQNPNDFELPINAMSYELRVNDKPFASGISNTEITVPGFGSEVIEVDAFSNLAGLVQHFSSFQGGEKSTLNYQLLGAMIVGSDNLKLPFRQSGEIALPAMLSRQYQIEGVSRE